MPVDPGLPGEDHPLASDGGPTSVRLAPLEPGDRQWMARALEQARLAALRGEVPVGAVLVRDGRLVAEGHNGTVTDADPTAHAEIRVLRAAARLQGDWRLGGCTLYVTLEPCAQCAGALVLARVDRVVYAASDPKAGMAGSLGNLLQDPRLNHRVALTAGVLAGEAGGLLRNFFRARRGRSAAPANGASGPPPRSLRSTLGLLGALVVGAVAGPGACTLATTPPPPAAPADLPPPSSERPRPDPPPTRGPGADTGAPAAGIPERPPAPPAPPAGAPTGSAVRPLPASLPAEVRALWVVRTALVHPDSVRAVVRRAEAGGFNTLLVQVRGRGDAWYASPREPRAVQLAHLASTYDPLQLLLDEARPRGLQVHAWINVHVVASAGMPPTDPGHLVRAHPEWLALPRELTRELGFMSPRDPRFLDTLLRWTRANAAQVEGLYTSPAHPGVRDRVVQVVEDLLRGYALDGIHLDYVRFASPSFDYSQEAIRGFRRWLAEGAPERAPELAPVRVPDLARLSAAEARAVFDATALPDAFPTEWARFRELQVTELVVRVAEVVRRLEPGALLSTAVFPDPRDARVDRFQAWEEWLATGWVDVVVPMAYTAEDPVYLRQLRQASTVAGPHRVWAGVGLYRNTFAGSVSKGRLARQEGMGGLALFSYDWAVGPEGRAASAGAGPAFAGAAETFLDRWARSVWGTEPDGGVRPDR